jgi:predicted DsbA family dithiol-disulfide isomerase
VLRRQAPAGEGAGARDPDVPTEIHWRPYQLAPDLPPEGKPRRQYMLDKFGDPERIRQIHERLTGIGAEEGIAFDFDRIAVAPNTLNAHRLILWARSPDIQGRVVEALFTAFFVEGRNLADDAELIAIGAACGLDASLLAELFPTDADVERTQREYASAQRIGVTGVPFFIVAGRYGIAGAEAPGDDRRRHPSGGGRTSGLTGYRPRPDKPLQTRREGARCGPWHSRRP